MSARAIQGLAAGVVELGPTVGFHRPAHLLDEDDVIAIRAALVTGRALLVRGEPGMGKSQLAMAAAKALRRPLVHHTVDASTEPRDVLYRIDAVARLADAQLRGAQNATESIPLGKYIHPGPLWWAFDWTGATQQADTSSAPKLDVPVGASSDHGVVLLLDEIDKADSSVPNALLDALGHKRFDVPTRAAVTMSMARPLVVITTNEERALPDAFLRRCFVRHLALPDRKGPDAVVAALLDRGRVHFPDERLQGLRTAAARLVAQRRVAMAGDSVSRPGVAEYIDLLDAVLSEETDIAQAERLLERVARFVLFKHAAPPES